MRDSYGNEPSASKSRLEAISEIIEKSRRVVGARTLEPEDLAGAAEDWEEILAEVPSAELPALYLEAQRTRNSTRFALQPVELLSLWKAKRGGVKRQPATALACGLCDGSGFQIVEIECPTLKRVNQQARPCGCSNQRKARPPLRPPVFERGSDGVWRSRSVTLPCHCWGCEKSSRFERSTLQYDSRDLEEAPCTR